jgi:predicted Zn-dependent peptidase
MQILRVGVLTAATVALLAALSSCGKNDQEAAKFERADNESFKRDMSDMSSFTLDNGITVYLQEERTDNQVAVEAIYGAGFMEEPKGKAQLSHVTEHLVVHCASGDFKAEESLGKISDIHGMVSAEAVAGFAHIDYIVPGDQLDVALHIESQRLLAVQCDNDVLARESKRVIGELDDALSNPKASLSKYAMMALNQVYYYGERDVPIRGNALSITLDEVQQFHDQYYRPDDFILVIIGNVKKADAEALVRKYFAPLPKRQAPTLDRTPITKNVKASWDIDAQSVYYVAPGPYPTFRDRLILSMFGSYLHQMLMTTQDVYSNCRAVYASNQVYRVGDIPFFMFAEPAQGRTNDDVAPLLVAQLEHAISALDDEHVEAIKGGMVSFQTSSMLKPDSPDYPMSHAQVIGQEALNVALKHAVREGRTVDEFDKEVNSVTPDEMRSVVKKYLDRSRLVEIRLLPKR